MHVDGHLRERQITTTTTTTTTAAMAGGIRDGKGRILRDTDQLFTDLAENYPHDKYTSFCNQFEVRYDSAEKIRIENMGNQTKALKQVLNKWLIDGEDVTREKLESALKNAKTGGLASIVKNNFEKDAVKEESAEEAGSDDQANNQATTSRAAGQSIAGNTFSVTNNVGTGNGEDRKRRTDEPNAGPSHKKKANDNTMSMTERHRTILEKSAPDLLNDLDTDDVLPLLLRDDVITRNHADEVKTKPTRREKVAALLEILPRRGDRAYAFFRDSLNEAKATHLYESMNKCEEACDQEQDVPTSQGAEQLTSSDQPSRGGNTQSGSITISASGSATVQNNTVTGQVNNITHN